MVTKDGHLIARHENVLAVYEGEATTNVADKPEYADRLTTKTLYGHEVKGWFSEDFTLAEIKSLRARERMPAVRPQNAALDDQFDIATFQEAAQLALASGVGLYPELKQPSYYAQLGVDVAALLRAELAAARVPIDDKLIVQSFEKTPLEVLRTELGDQVQLVQLSRSAPDFAEVARYASGVGVPIGVAFTPGFIVSARASGLRVHPYTLRAEADFLPEGVSFEMVLARLVQAGADGVFTDHPGRARNALGCTR